MSFSFQKKHRILNRREFEQLSRNSVYHSFSKFSINIRQVVASHSRLGITATRKFGCSVKRNRFKRLIREVFRINFKNIPNVDVLVRAKQSQDLPTLSEIKEGFQNALSTYLQNI